MDETASAKRTVVFFHPDLGIGGAERLVVDAAVGLQQRGHRVVIFTSHCDPSHCFDEVRAGSGILDVRVRGNVVPPTVLGRLAIACAIARQTHLLLTVWRTGELAALAPTACFVDQLSAGVPLLRALLLPPAAPLLFYCHFPDLLLAQGRQRWWKRLYRRPFDALEQWSMGFADAVAVNSRFTRAVVARTWPRLADHTDLRVVYPCVPGDLGDDDDDDDNDDNDDDVTLWRDVPFVLSINRFERKKDIGLAVRAFAGLPGRLVIAGGYDPRVAENVAYHAELDALAQTLGLRTATATSTAAALAVDPAVQVLFLPSVSSALKARLLRTARLLVYTPAHEHFGIVPVEAMRAGLPVLACDSGGPTESVLDGHTGWLRPADDPPAWAAVLATALAPLDSPAGLDADRRARMAAAGRDRVRSLFARPQMAAHIDAIYDELRAAASAHPAQPGLSPTRLLGLGLLGALLTVMVTLLAVLLVGSQ